MLQESLISKIISSFCTPLKSINYTPLIGGLSTSSLYRFEHNQHHYVVRLLPAHLDHKTCSHHVNITSMAGNVGIGPKVHFVDANGQAITDFVEIPHERNTIDFKKQVEALKKANPDTILFSTNATPIRGIIRQMGVEFFSGKKLLGVSVYEDAFEEFLKNKGLKFVLIRMVPDPEKSDLQIAKEYRAAADAVGMKYDKVSFEQYINASIFFELLKRIEGVATKEKIIDAAQRIKNHTFKGLKLDFNPETRELSPVLWIDSGTRPWIEKSTRNGTAITEKNTVSYEPANA